MAIPGIEARFASVRINTSNWRILARSNISSPVVLRATDLRQILLVLPRQAREPDREVVPFGKAIRPLSRAEGSGCSHSRLAGSPSGRAGFRRVPSGR
ncbi:MAG: hypothetical protein JWM63_1325 [Gammaproteobacteria bacterium]|jgi:hypothetical protein|nr:hypothetical protein [Gammaproteobacteria bacterium]